MMSNQEGRSTLLTLLLIVVAVLLLGCAEAKELDSDIGKKPPEGMLLIDRDSGCEYITKRARFNFLKGGGINYLTVEARVNQAGKQVCAKEQQQ